MDVPVLPPSVLPGHRSSSGSFGRFMRLKRRGAEKRTRRISASSASLRFQRPGSDVHRGGTRRGTSIIVPPVHVATAAASVPGNHGCPGFALVSLTTLSAFVAFLATSSDGLAHCRALTPREMRETTGSDCVACQQGHYSCDYPGKSCGSQCKTVISPGQPAQRTGVTGTSGTGNGIGICGDKLQTPKGVRTIDAVQVLCSKKWNCICTVYLQGKKCATGNCAAGGMFEW
jgi:hypothetical protein